MPRKRKYFTAEEKVAILRLHLIEKVPVEAFSIKKIPRNRPISRDFFD